MTPVKEKHAARMRLRSKWLEKEWLKLQRITQTKINLGLMTEREAEQTRQVFWDRVRVDKKLAES